MKFTRQEGLVDMKKVQEAKVTLIGAGATGSFIALALTKLGVQHLEVYDDDGVAEHNIANQFYREDDAKREVFKVSALQGIVKEFNDVRITTHIAKYTGEATAECVVIATDNMAARKLAWDKFKDSFTAKYFIDARMGGELGIVYVIGKEFYEAPECLKPATSDRWVVSSDSQKFYEETLHSDEEAEPLPCTARAVIYNVLPIAGLACRAFKALVTEEENFPREIVFDMKHMMYMDRR